MRLATHVRTLGCGQGRARSLTKAEAADAMVHMLDDDADPHAVGALLMLLRMKGEVAEEISGFVEAIQGSFSQLPPVDLDWPSYSSGRTRGLPWFLLSARLVAEAGYRVCLHGWNGADMTVRDGLKSAGIKCARTFHDTDLALRSNGIVYLPLELLSPRLKQLLDLRSVLGLRSCLKRLRACLTLLKQGLRCRACSTPPTVTCNRMQQPCWVGPPLLSSKAAEVSSSATLGKLFKPLVCVKDRLGRRDSTNRSISRLG